MATYTQRAAASGGTDKEQPVAALGPVRRGSDGTRRSWWWQAGPVDSCCYGFSLRAGVGILATIDLLHGMAAIFYMHTFYVSNLQALLNVIEYQYEQTCSGSDAFDPGCLELMENLEQAEGHVDVYLHLPLSVYAQGVICIVAGFVGVGAAFIRSELVAKVYMLSWPTKFWLGVWAMLNIRKLQVKHDVGEGSTTAIVWLLHAVYLIYSFKVSWSYYNIRRGHEQSAISSASTNNIAREEEDMIEMSNSV